MRERTGFGIVFALLLVPISCSFLHRRLISLNPGTPELLTPQVVESNEPLEPTWVEHPPSKQSPGPVAFIGHGEGRQLDAAKTEATRDLLAAISAYVSVDVSTEMEERETFENGKSSLEVRSATRVRSAAALQNIKPDAFYWQRITSPVTPDNAQFRYHLRATVPRRELTRVRTQKQIAREKTTGRKMVAFLPFAEHSDPLAAGLVETLRQRFLAHPALHVMEQPLVNGVLPTKPISRKALVGRVVDSLLPDRVIDGAYLRQGDRLRLTAVVYDGRTQHALHTERVEGSYQDLFDLTESLSKSLEAVVGAKKDDRPQVAATRPEPNLAAFEAYNLAYVHYAKGANEEAKKEVERAISISSSHPAFYLRLGRVLERMGRYARIPPTPASQGLNARLYLCSPEGRRTQHEVQRALKERASKLSAPPQASAWWTEQTPLVDQVLAQVLATQVVSSFSLHGSCPERYVSCGALCAPSQEHCAAVETAFFHGVSRRLKKVNPSQPVWLFAHRSARLFPEASSNRVSGSVHGSEPLRLITVSLDGGRAYVSFQNRHAWVLLGEIVAASLTNKRPTNLLHLSPLQPTNLDSSPVYPDVSPIRPDVPDRPPPPGPPGGGMRRTAPPDRVERIAPGPPGGGIRAPGRPVQQPVARRPPPQPTVKQQKDDCRSLPFLCPLGTFCNDHGGCQSGCETARDCSPDQYCQSRACRRLPWPVRTRTISPVLTGSLEAPPVAPAGLTSAVEAYAHALLLARWQRDEQMQAEVARALADLAVRVDRLDAARTIYQQLYWYGRTTKDPHVMSIALFGLGVVAHKQVVLPRARKLLMAALQERMQLGEKPYLLEIYNELGGVLSEMAAYHEAQTFFERAERLADDLNNPYLGAVLSNNIGVLTFYRGRAMDADERVTVAWDFLSNLGEAEGRVASGLNHGFLSGFRGSFIEAAETFDTVEQIVEETMQEGRLAQLGDIRGAFEVNRGQMKDGLTRLVTGWSLHRRLSQAVPLSRVQSSVLAAEYHGYPENGVLACLKSVYWQLQVPVYEAPRGTRLVQTVADLEPGSLQLHDLIEALSAASILPLAPWKPTHVRYTHEVLEEIKVVQRDDRRPDRPDRPDRRPAVTEERVLEAPPSRVAPTTGVEAEPIPATPKRPAKKKVEGGPPVAFEKPAEYERILGAFTLDADVVVFLKPAVCTRHLIPKHLGTAERMLTAILAHFEALGAPRYAAVAHLNLGALLWFDYQPEEAYRHVMAAFTTFAETGDVQGLAHAYEWLGFFFNESGDIDLSGTQLSLAHGLFGVLGDEAGQERVLGYAE